MENIELQQLWKAQDQKLQTLLSINQAVVTKLSQQELHQKMRSLYRPKWTAIIIGLPYTLLLLLITMFALAAKAYLVALGFGAIALLMLIVLGNYGYQLYLISEIRHTEAVLSTQQLLAKLRISSFNCINFAVFQLPFWSLCWISIDALKASPLLYGGINLLVFLLLSYLAYWLFQQLNHQSKPSKIRDFFLSGSEWEPIHQSAALLEQIKEYEH